MMNRNTLESIISNPDTGGKPKVIITANCESFESSNRLYEFLKISLVDVNQWRRFCPGMTIQPRLTDKHGQLVDRQAKENDLVKILLPRWQAVGRLYDWHAINRIEEQLSGNTEIFHITLMPVLSPETDVPEPSHFLRPESTVTFFVIRDELKLELQVHMRNEAMNFHVSGIRTRVQSAFMGIFITGGFYEAQWIKLIKSILSYGMSQIKSQERI